MATHELKKKNGGVEILSACLPQGSLSSLAAHGEPFIYITESWNLLSILLVLQLLVRIPPILF